MLSLRAFLLDTISIIWYKNIMREYLEIFGLKKLSRSGLKKAYKRLSKIYHPDNIETGDKERFVEINNIYEWLLKETIKKTFVISVSIDDLIKGKKINLFDNVFVNISCKMLNKPYIFKYENEKYKIILKPTLDKDEKLFYHKGKLKLVKTIWVSKDE